MTDVLAKYRVHTTLPGSYVITPRRRADFLAIHEVDDDLWCWFWEDDRQRQTKGVIHILEEGADLEKRDIKEFKGITVKGRAVFYEEG